MADTESTKNRARRTPGFYACLVSVLLGMVLWSVTNPAVTLIGLFGADKWTLPFTIAGGVVHVALLVIAARRTREHWLATIGIIVNAIGIAMPIGTFLLFLLVAQGLRAG